MNKFQWPVGATFVFSVPPSWVLGGTVREVHEDVLVLQDGVYFETMKNGASLGDYAAAADNVALGKASDRSWPLVDGFIVRKDCITHAMPCQMSFERLAKAKQIAAIKGA